MRRIVRPQRPARPRGSDWPTVRTPATCSTPSTAATVIAAPPKHRRPGVADRRGHRRGGRQPDVAAGLAAPTGCRRLALAAVARSVALLACCSCCWSCSWHCRRRRVARSACSCARRRGRCSWLARAADGRRRRSAPSADTRRAVDHLPREPRLRLSATAADAGGTAAPGRRPTASRRRRFKLALKRLGLRSRPRRPRSGPDRAGQLRPRRGRHARGRRGARAGRDDPAPRAGHQHARRRTSASSSSRRSTRSRPTRGSTSRCTSRSRSSATSCSCPTST